MGYLSTHTEHECDRCLTNVGVENLKPSKYLYMDKNDKMHPDQGHGYRLYYLCNECYKEEFE